MNQTSAEGPRPGCAADVSREFTVTSSLLLKFPGPDKTKMVDLAKCIWGTEPDPVVQTD